MNAEPTFFTEATFAMFSQLRKHENIELANPPGRPPSAE
jgi:hypothetical protein